MPELGGDSPRVEIKEAVYEDSGSAAALAAAVRIVGP